MQITVSGKRIELSDALHEHVWHDVNSLGHRYPSEPMTARITFARERRFFMCRVTVKATNMELRSRGEAADAYYAFDLAMGQMSKRLAEARLKRYHRRRESTAENGFRTLLRSEPEEDGTC